MSKNGTATAAPKARNKPAHEVRLGRIKAAVWANEGENGLRYNVTFSRLYKVENVWKDSQSFGRDDLPLVAKIADQVHSWIFAQAATTAATNEEQDDNIPY